MTNDRDVEAKPGDRNQTELDGDALDLPGDAKRLVVPRRADLTRGDQARRRAPESPTARAASGSKRPEVGAVSVAIRYCHECGGENLVSDRRCGDCGMYFEPLPAPGPMATPVRPARGARPPAIATAATTPAAARPAKPVRPVTSARPLSAPAEPILAEKAHQTREPAATPRLTAPHPLSRLRQERRAQGLHLSLDGLSGIVQSLRSGRVAGSKGGTPRRRARRGLRLGRPSLRGLVGFAGMTATFGIVTALLVTLPSQPVRPIGTGSIYGVSWAKAGAAPVAKLDFGPYFTTVDQDLLMLGTVVSTPAGSTTPVATTTVWATHDGSTWTQRSASGAFDVGGRRFVAQGISDDGHGGLVVVGNSIGSKSTDVTASAWHSRDGGSWTPMEVASGGGQEMVAGVATQSGAVVTAGNGVAWLSTDGRSWTPEVLPGVATSGGSYTPRAVGSWNGGFVIVGLWNGSVSVRSTAWYSPNGRDWTQAKTSLDGFDVRGISSLNGKIVAVGMDLGESAPGLAASWSSDDGSTWTKTTAPTDIAAVGMDGVANVNGSLVAFGAPSLTTASAAASPASPLPGSTPQATASEVVWVSESGLDWIPITATTSPLTRARMASIGNRIVMVGGTTSGLGAVSGDLVLGAVRATVGPSAPPANYALNVKVGNNPMIPDVTKEFSLGPVTNSKNNFYLFALGPTGTSIFSSSDGGGLWSQELKPAGLTSLVVTAAPIASGSSAQPSASGASAQPQASAAPQAVVTGRPVVLQAIPDGSGGVIAVGKVTDTSGDNGMIWHMTKAGEWRQVQFADDAPPEFASVVAGPGGFVASSDKAGGSPIMHSTDGETWQAGTISVGDGFALTVATYRYGFVAVGTDAARAGATTAWTSPDGRTWTMRTDWHLPANVSALFSVGGTLVATAKTAPPAAPSSSASRSASRSATVSASSGASPSPTLAPTPTPSAAAVQATTTWWYSTTGVAWQKSGLETTSRNWAIVNGRVLVLDPTTDPAASWTAWTSSDGVNWQHPPTTGTELIDFAGSKTCVIASNGDQIIVVGWDAPGSLKDFLGTFTSQ